MNPTEDRMLREALELSPEARASLACSLIDSLEAEPDANAEAAWEAEIAARIVELDEGRARVVAWSEARRAILGN
jgi:putative addiction module component (TIGR02574 family)